MRILSLITIVALFSGCATMSKSECKIANWQDVGFKDGSSGDSVLLADHIESCAETKVKPNKVQYMLGYNKGEQSYCTYSNGLKAGEKNKYINDICNKPGLKDNFHDGYMQGKKRYAVRQEIIKKEKELKDLEKEIKEIKLTGNVGALDLAYRNKEVINREINVLEKNLSSIR